jgi:hypothetical protein
MANEIADIAAVVIGAFMAGALLGVLIMVAAVVKSEDAEAMQRADRSLPLRERARGDAAYAIHWLTGVGLRT